MLRQMRMRPRGESDVGEMIVLVVFVAVLGLIGYGGYALYRDHVAKPDDKCYWMVEQAARGSDPCLLDVPSDVVARGSVMCMPYAQAQGHFVICAERQTLPDFANKAGRRICGQLAHICDETKK